MISLDNYSNKVDPWVVAQLLLPRNCVWQEIVYQSIVVEGHEIGTPHP